MTKDADDGMTYADTGVNYDDMDPFKRKCLSAAIETVGNIERLGFRALLESYGESVFLIEPTDDVPFMSADVNEGLGTKNLVADAMYRLTGKSYYDQIAQDTVAMIVNDMITLGALPLSVKMHLDLSKSNWVNDEKRTRDLVEGWKNACNMSRCVWSGGETATLKDMMEPRTAILSGSAMGCVKPKERLIATSNLQGGDAIVLVASSGIHANSLSMARQIADKLPEGYLTKLDDGRTYGEALLDPTIIYVPLVEECLNAGIPIHYTVNITGHGWRKLMRAPQPFTYVLEKIPEPQPVFRSIQEHGPVSFEEMYGNLNMGAGFVFYVPDNEVQRVIELAKTLGMSASHAGHIETSKEKKVVIQPLNLEYCGETLRVR